jgi:sulfite reductase beta subunit-like hemoprotein
MDKALSMETVDIEAVKQAGLTINFDAFKQKGARGLSFEDRYRLKTYGICGQKHPGYFMLRQRVPGGALTSKQVAGLVGLCEAYGRGLAHITTRQSLELHWIRLEEAQPIFEKLQSLGITSRSACGHTIRNVVACPHGNVAAEGLFDVTPWAERMAHYYTHQAESINPTLPSRLNLFFSGCAQCNADAPFHDIAFVACRGERTEAIGFELWVGGSLASDPKPGFKIKSFIAPEELLPACQAVVELHARFSNRQRGQSRLKHLIAQWGREKFIEMFDATFFQKKGHPIDLPIPTQEDAAPQPGRFWQWLVERIPSGALPPGATPQRQPGYARLTIDLPMGEIRSAQLAMVGQIAKKHGNDRIYFTRDQKIEIHWVSGISSVLQKLHKVGLRLAGDRPTLVACPGTEFCSLAVTHAQGTGRAILKQFRPDSEEKAALFHSLAIHISGCANGCARHGVADIGFAGVMTQVDGGPRLAYQLFLGGREERMTAPTAPPVARPVLLEERVVPAIDALLTLVLEHRKSEESFSGVVARIGASKMIELLGLRLLNQPAQKQEGGYVAMVPDLMEKLS